MHILENAIHKDIFDILHSYSYNDENSDPKVFINTLTKILMKNTFGSIQSIEEELFIIKTESFDNLKTYFSYVIYLR